MSCIYEEKNGVCSLWDEETQKEDDYSNSEMGFSQEHDGGCAVSDDPDPYKNCSSFEPVDPDGYENS